MTESLVQKYKKGYTYSSKPYPDNRVGNWEVRGEDPNCDFGGWHHQPYLGTFYGTFIDVLELAVEMPQFWQWGAGGEVKAVEIKKIDSMSNLQRAKLKQELQDIEIRAAKIKKQLKI